MNTFIHPHVVSVHHSMRLYSLETSPHLHASRLVMLLWFVQLHYSYFCWCFRSLIKGATIVLSFGRRYGLVGRNGRGKSTLLRMISRWIPPALHSEYSSLIYLLLVASTTADTDNISHQILQLIDKPVIPQCWTSSPALHNIEFLQTGYESIKI